MKNCKIKVFFCLLWLMSYAAYADMSNILLEPSELSESSVSSHFLPTGVAEARWVFSGMVESETGEQYGYFFQIDRLGHTFRSQAALFDVQTKARLIEEHGEAEIADPSTYRWQVGHAFLRFNPITDSWVFGIKQANKAGFNFKVDMLKAAETLPQEQPLRLGISVLVSQAHSLNGHIKSSDGQKEQFVTAGQAWFRQTSVTAPQADLHAVKGVLCGFEDGTGFYAVNLPEEDALRGAIAGQFNAQGSAAPMSQFVQVKALSEGQWGIHVPLPNEHILLSGFLQQQAAVAGVAAVGDKKGFCLLSEDTLGHKDDLKTDDVKTV